MLPHDDLTAREPYAMLDTLSTHRSCGMRIAPCPSRQATSRLFPKEARAPCGPSSPSSVAQTVTLRNLFHLSMESVASRDPIHAAIRW